MLEVEATVQMHPYIGDTADSEDPREFDPSAPPAFVQLTADEQHVRVILNSVSLNDAGPDFFFERRPDGWRCLISPSGGGGDPVLEVYIAYPEPTADDPVSPRITISDIDRPTTRVVFSEQY